MRRRRAKNERKKRQGLKEEEMRMRGRREYDGRKKRKGSKEEKKRIRENNLFPFKPRLSCLSRSHRL